jgi:hypothetical protein
MDSRGAAAICTSMSTRPPKEDHLSTERNAVLLGAFDAVMMRGLSAGDLPRLAHSSDEWSHGLKVSAAAVDDESSQDNERHNCGSDRPPVIFAPPWVGPPAVVAARRATALVFEA